MAKLRLEQIGDLPIMKMEEKEEIMKQELEEDIKPCIINEKKDKTPKLGPKKLGKITRTKEFPKKRKLKKVHNPKGKTIYTQARRAGKMKKVVDERDEWEVQGIEDERTNPKTGQKWVGWKNCTWQPEINLENALEILKEWNQRRKLQMASAVGKGSRK